MDDSLLRRGLGAPWDTQLLECLSDGRVCLVSLCCPTCQLAHQKAIIENKDCSPIDAVLIMCCPLCCLIKIQYLIDGNCTADFLSALCCGVCAVAQQHRQLQLKGDRPHGCFMD
eukprot:TRINITY_DN19929_c0_g1_i1.p3 TRINITY_DN19929_c0_g1~~TRINITY_DN19929_c0_g1_i1.p3  ORF type:complete len:114 (+),score=39.67 TRINITY_DN19929_c0_g1_i1:60-401(+)